MSKKPIEVKNISKSNLDEIEGLCVPDDMMDDPRFIEGNMLWKRWIKDNLDRYDTVGKIVYFDSVPVGSIQYIPKPKDMVVEIKCMYVDDGNLDLRKELLNHTIKEFRRPKSYFGYRRAKALVTYAFPVPRYIGNGDFYRENGFQQVADDDEHFLFYPLIKNYGNISKPDHPPIDEKDRDKVLIFCNSSCPYCVKEMMEVLGEFRRIDRNSPIKIIVPFEETERLSHVFSMPTCIVINDKVIEYSLMEDYKFIDEVKQVLYSSQEAPRDEVVIRYDDIPHGHKDSFERIKRMLEPNDLDLF